jgi:hypothetical protein
MKNGKLMIAAFAVLVAGAVSARAEGGTMGKLAETSGKISSIDMNKNLSEAGNLLGGFYAGSKAKAGSDTDVVYADRGNSQSPKQTEKDICNAQSSKIVKLGAQVKPLAASSSRTVGSQTRGSSWVDDFNTVVDYVGHVGSHAVETVDASNVGTSEVPDYGGVINGVISTIDAAVNP